MSRITKSDRALVALNPRALLATAACFTCGDSATQYAYIDPNTAADRDTLTTVAAWIDELAKMRQLCDTCA